MKMVICLVLHIPFISRSRNTGEGALAIGVPLCISRRPITRIRIQIPEVIPIASGSESTRRKGGCRTVRGRTGGKFPAAGNSPRPAPASLGFLHFRQRLGGDFPAQTRETGGPEQRIAAAE